MAALKISIIGDTKRLGKSFFNALKQADGFANKMKLIGPPVATAVATMGTAFAGFALKSAGEFAKIEKKWAEVMTIMPGESKETLDKMERDLRQFAVSTGSNIEEVMSATYQAISAGLDTNDLLDFMDVARDAALAGVTELSTGVDALTSVINGYGLEASAAKGIADQLQTTVRLGKTTWQELNDVMKDIVPITATLGVSLEEPLAAIVALTKQGVPTVQAGTRIRQMFAELAKEGRVASDRFKEITGESFPDFIAGGGDVIDAIALLAEHAENAGLTILDYFRSVEAGQAAAGLALETGSANYIEAIDDIIDSTGELNDAVDIMEDTTAQRLAEMGAAWTEFKLKVGETTVGVVEEIGKVPDKFASAYQETEEETGGFLSAVGGSFVGLWETIVNTVDRIGETIRSLGWGIGDVVWDIINVSLLKLKLAFEVFEGTFKTFAAVLKGDWSAAWDEIKQTFIDVWNSLVEVFRIGWNAFIWPIQTKLNLLVEAFDQAFMWVVRGVGHAMGAMMGLVADAVNAIINRLTQADVAETVAGWLGFDLNIIPDITISSDLVEDMKNYSGFWDGVDWTVDDGFGKIGGGEESPYSTDPGQTTTGPPGGAYAKTPPPGGVYGPRAGEAGGEADETDPTAYKYAHLNVNGPGGGGGGSGFVFTDLMAQVVDSLDDRQRAWFESQTETAQRQWLSSLQQTMDNSIYDDLFPNGVFGGTDDDTTTTTTTGGGGGGSGRAPFVMTVGMMDYVAGLTGAAKAWFDSQTTEVQQSHLRAEQARLDREAEDRAFNPRVMTDQMTEYMASLDDAQRAYYDGLSDDDFWRAMERYQSQWESWQQRKLFGQDSTPWGREQIAEQQAAEAARAAADAQRQAEQDERERQRAAQRVVPEKVAFRVLMPDQTEADFEVDTADLLSGNDRQVRASVGSRQTRTAGACG